MTTLLVTLHVLVSLVLIGVVLIQRGQGADIGASFGGGGAQTLFGSRGSGSFLGKLTGALAAVFMLTSLTLAFFSQQKTGSVVEKQLVTPQPVQEQTLPASGPADFDPSKLKDESSKDQLPGVK